uniref:Uncharacterized protein n=1 Tax=Cacopsylla melanoneura TaxID=428564 RepID=A0A8D8L9F5_9HEMI
MGFVQYITYTLFGSMSIHRMSPSHLLGTIIIRMIRILLKSFCFFLHTLLYLQYRFILCSIILSRPPKPTQIVVPHPTTTVLTRRTRPSISRGVLHPVNTVPVHNRPHRVGSHGPHRPTVRASPHGEVPWHVSSWYRLHHGVHTLSPAVARVLWAGHDRGAGARAPT